jgi:DNA-directed RNA polymerase III subunit RPC1
MSIGIGDVTPFEKLNEEKNILLEIGYRNCDKLIESYKNGELELKAGCNAE